MSVSDNHGLTSPSKKVPKTELYHYQSIFKKALDKRLFFLLKVSFLLSWLLSLIISLSSYGLFKWVGVSLIEGPILFIGIALIKAARELNITVEYSPYKTLGRQIVGEILSYKFVTSCVAYISSSTLCYILVYLRFNDFSYRVITKEYNSRALINDEVVFYFFYTIYFGLLYAAQHVIFQKDRLRFTYGVSRVKPEDAYFENFHNIMGNSVAFTLVTTFSSPIVYFFLKSPIYKVVLYPLYWPLNLSSQIPGLSISIGLILRLLYTGFFLSFTWEFTNHLFNVYAQIGCLHGNKSLSTFSNDPIHTMLTGLRDFKHPFVRLTAFQELAYLTTSDDPKHRTAFYNAHYKTSYVWPTILEECASVIKDSCRKINSGPKKPIPVNKLKFEEEKIHDFIQPKVEIFGNSHADVSNSTMLDEGVKDKINSKPLNDYMLSSKDSTAFKINESLKHFTNEKVNELHLSTYIKEVQTVWQKTCSDFLQSGIGIFFRKTMKREAESRCPNPINFGNAILSISYLLIHSADEDTVGVVSGTLTEVLILLENCVSTCGLFTENPPVDVYNPNKNHVIGLLHDLAMKCFFDVAVKYNALLNDLLLPPDVFKLAKWTIDIAIAQQKQFDSHNILDGESD